MICTSTAKGRAAQTMQQLTGCLAHHGPLQGEADLALRGVSATAHCLQWRHRCAACVWHEFTLHITAQCTSKGRMQEIHLCLCANCHNSDSNCSAGVVVPKLFRGLLGLPRYLELGVLYKASRCNPV